MTDQPPTNPKERFKLSTHTSRRLKFYLMCELAKPSLKRQELENVQTLLKLCCNYCVDDDRFDEMVQADNERLAKQREEQARKVKVVKD